MLERPDLPDEQIITCLLENYGLFTVDISFLPLGADFNTSVFRVVAADNETYFLKLRTGSFNGISLRLPDFFNQMGIKQIISPLPTRTGALSLSLGSYNVVLYPFIHGENGFDVDLSDRQWIDFGQSLQRIHSATLPEIISSQIPVWKLSGRWRESLAKTLAGVENGVFDDPLRQQLVAFLRVKRAEILDLIRQADWFATKLRISAESLVLCHSDIHAGNILIEPEGQFFIVDWDDPIWAPKERDLMSIGAGIGGVWNSNREETLFYEGYGPTQIDKNALIYFRYERIIEDLAIFIEDISETPEGGADRQQSFHYLTSSFLPGRVIEIANNSGKIV